MFMLRLLLSFCAVSSAMAAIHMDAKVSRQGRNPSRRTPGIVELAAARRSQETLGDRKYIFTVDVEIGGQTVTLQVDTGLSGLPCLARRLSVEKGG
jgi:hypothetical protein